MQENIGCMKNSFNANFSLKFNRYFGMKITLSGIVLILCISFTVQAQDSPLASKSETVLTLKFIPSEIPLESTHNQLSAISTANSGFLFSVGLFLQGLKFSSQFDRFHAFAPFDIRGYKPNSVQQYQFLLNTNSLLFDKK